MAGGSSFNMGLILDRAFHAEDRWVSASTPKLVDGIIQEFDPWVLSSQREYKDAVEELDVIVSIAPGFAAPKIDLHRRFLGLVAREEPPLSYVFYSDPHKKRWRERYFRRGGFDFVLTPYRQSVLRHMPKIPDERVIRFPWPVYDEWVHEDDITYEGHEDLLCFGAGGTDAYELRDWCRGFPYVRSRENSGVQDKQMTPAGYMEWLAEQDAAIAAGSDDPKYRLTVPKYFEIAAAGCLLFAQRTGELEAMGFRDGENCIMFDRDDFEERAQAYLESPEEHLHIRKAGRDLVRNRHTVTQRLEDLREHIEDHL